MGASCVWLIDFPSFRWQVERFVAKVFSPVDRSGQHNSSVVNGHGRSHSQLACHRNLGGDGLEDDGDDDGDDGMALSQDWCQHHLDLRPGVAETLLSMLSLSPHHAIELLPSVILTAGSVDSNGVRTCVFMV